MSKNETKKFLMQDTFMAKLTTVNKGGSPHLCNSFFTCYEMDMLILSEGNGHT
jgi:hypothetical protein